MTYHFDFTTSPPEGALTPKHASLETGASLTCLNNCCLKRQVKPRISLKQHHVSTLEFDLNWLMASVMLDRNQC